jgi:hypothetical protein
LLVTRLFASKDGGAGGFVTPESIFSQIRGE